jgi:hypothetical protein
MYFKIGFYDVYCKGMRSQFHMQILNFFVWPLIMNSSGDGLLEKPGVVTRRAVNCVMHDGILSIYI